jgi:hypothetical protein
LESYSVALQGKPLYSALYSSYSDAEWLKKYPEV